MGLFSGLFSSAKTADLSSLVQQGAMLVDVREPAEFSAGSVKGAVNIPLSTIADSFNDFKGKENIIVFCRSGNRSAQAKRILDQQGIKHVVNGGTWQQVAQYAG